MILERLVGRLSLTSYLDLRPSASVQRMYHAPCMHAVAHTPQHTHLHTHLHAHVQTYTPVYNICTYTLTSTPSNEVWPTILSTSTDSFVLTRYPLKLFCIPKQTTVLCPPRIYPSTQPFWKPRSTQLSHLQTKTIQYASPLPKKP